MPIDTSALQDVAHALVGTHRFIAFAARGSVPDPHDHRCIVTHASWSDRPGGLTFVIEANRFLHHMVRFVVGTSIAIASGARPLGDLAALLAADSNDGVSPPAPPHALFLDRVTYPDELYLTPACP
jgi:tRNA pseudouridine38-40 synthase